jgi:hypothetical protein
MYLKSIELRDYHVAHRLEFVRHLHPNKVVVTVHPAIPAFVYKTKTDLEEVMLAPRYRGDTLPPSFPLVVPLIVNICLPKTEGGSLDQGPWTIQDVGQITETI